MSDETAMIMAGPIPGGPRLARSPPQKWVPPPRRNENSNHQKPQIAAATRKPAARKYPKPVLISIGADEWNRGDLPEPEPEPDEGPQLIEREAVPEYIPLELRGLPEWNGSVSLLDALVAHGMPGLSVADIRGLARVCKVFKRDMDDDEVWRLSCAALATQHGLYAPSDSVHWRTLFFDTLWPARGKWKGVEASEATGFRIRVCARLRPRKHASNKDGLVLPLHQRLKLLKKDKNGKFTQKLGSLEDEIRGSSQEQLKQALEQQGDLPPDLLQALLEAQQLDAVMGQAESQARGGPKGKGDVEVEEGSHAAHAAAAASDAANDTSKLTKENFDALKEAEQKAKEGEDPEKKKKEEEEEKAKEEEEASKKANGSRLLLVQPTKVVMFIPGCGVRPFLFSQVCDEQVEQKEVYQRVAQDAVVSALNGMNACVLAYGQTGSGKTHTVFGPAGAIEACAEMAETEAHWLAVEGCSNAHLRGPSAQGLAAATKLPGSAGIVLRACDELLNCRKAPGASCNSIKVSAQYIQIYEETLTDLLSGGSVQLRDAGDYAETGQERAILQGAAHVQLESLNDALALLRAGELHKKVLATAMNDASSRGHTVFLISITQRGEGSDGDEAGGEGEEAEGERLITSQLALVDLAGCEQLKQSKVTGQGAREAIGINSSLLVLGKCITALSEGRRHVPYQEAKLTKLLRGAFGGSSRTTCVIAASPDDAHAENTVQALRFGERCATITNSAKIGAVSAAQALAVVDEALASCEQSMRNLEAKDRTNLPAYGSLKARHASLQMRRQALATA